jgi:hypothetical protein
MAKNITFSIVILVPLVGIGGWVGSSIGAQTVRLEPTPTVTIQPLEMHRATDMRKLPEQEISSLF